MKGPAAAQVDVHNHDTIAMIAIDANGSIAAGASSNGANHKVRAGGAAQWLQLSGVFKGRVIIAEACTRLFTR